MSAGSHPRRVSETAFDPLSGTERRPSWIDIEGDPSETGVDALAWWKAVAVFGALVIVEALLFYWAPRSTLGGWEASSWQGTLIAAGVILVILDGILVMAVGKECGVAILSAAGVAFVLAALLYGYTSAVETIQVGSLLLGAVALLLGLVQSIDASRRLDTT